MGTVTDLKERAVHSNLRQLERFFFGLAAAARWFVLTDSSSRG
jgi:hypothetical protein